MTAPCVEGFADTSGIGIALLLWSGTSQLDVDPLQQSNRLSVTPSSFYVREKNKQGDPVAMVIGPDSFTEVTEMPVPTMKSGSTMAIPPADSTAPATTP